MPNLIYFKSEIPDLSLIETLFGFNIEEETDTTVKLEIPFDRPDLAVPSLFKAYLNKTIEQVNPMRLIKCHDMHLDLISIQSNIVISRSNNNDSSPVFLCSLTTSYLEKISNDYGRLIETLIKRKSIRTTSINSHDIQIDNKKELIKFLILLKYVNNTSLTIGVSENLWDLVMEELSSIPRTFRYFKRELIPQLSRLGYSLSQFNQYLSTTTLFKSKTASQYPRGFNIFHIEAGALQQSNHRLISPFIEEQLYDLIQTDSESVYFVPPDYRFDLRDFNDILEDFIIWISTDYNAQMKKLYLFKDIRGYTISRSNHSLPTIDIVLLRTLRNNLVRLNMTEIRCLKLGISNTFSKVIFKNSASRKKYYDDLGLSYFLEKAQMHRYEKKNFFSVLRANYLIINLLKNDRLLIMDKIHSMLIRMNLEFTMELCQEIKSYKTTLSSTTDAYLFKFK